MAVTVYDRNGQPFEYPRGSYITVDDDQPLRIWDEDGELIGVFNQAAWTHVKEIVPPKPGKRTGVKTGSGSGGSGAPVPGSWIKAKTVPVRVGSELVLLKDGGVKVPIFVGDSEEAGYVTISAHEVERRGILSCEHAQDK
ncbi:hypothetical protein SEA_PARLIAMENT_3 [Mycobacterium phage Parliament]|nr:hypothetical protein SEA_NIZA_5 [Mycobacterium phage Niza]UDL16106.1 hypothetical protein SEA_PARLIAMENT_3 [Mycobacterium phage Parliament]